LDATIFDRFDQLIRIISHDVELDGTARERSDQMSRAATTTGMGGRTRGRAAWVTRALASAARPNRLVVA
jgi:hypothetical protein